MIVAASGLGGFADQAIGARSASPSRTAVVRWSPFDSSSRIKKTLSIKRATAAGTCWDGASSSESVGGVASRCSFGNAIADPCWRDGAGATEWIVCAASPWVRSVDLVRVPGLMLRAGVTYESASDYPWALELVSGDRCVAFQGAHDSTTGREGGIAIDYYCADGLVLLRNLRRGARWRIGSARHKTHGRGYRLLGDVTIRRAFLGGLPPEMNRQNEAAAAAVAAVMKLVRDQFGQQTLNDLYPSRVRLALPERDWAYVRVWFPKGDSDLRYRSVVVHRVGSRWVRALNYRPYCHKLPEPVRRQLFDWRDCSKSR